MSHRAWMRQTIVTLVGFALIGVLSFALDHVQWWQLALIVVVPYGAAIYLAGREPAPART